MTPEVGVQWVSTQGNLESRGKGAVLIAGIRTHNQGKDRNSSGAEEDPTHAQRRGQLWLSQQCHQAGQQDLQEETVSGSKFLGAKEESPHKPPT